MSKTPEVDALVKRHEEEIDSIPWGNLPPAEAQRHITLQVIEHIVLACSLESRLAEAREEIARLKERIKELTGEEV